MPDPDEQGLYSVTRMLPPGPHKYFYSVANVPKVALDQPSCANDPNQWQPKIAMNIKEIPDWPVIDIDKVYFSKSLSKVSTIPTA